MTATTKATTAKEEPAATEPEPADKTKYATELTWQEVLDSVTGYDEIGLKNTFHTTFDEIGGYGDKDAPVNESLLVRALIGVHRLHEGDAPAVAWSKALSATRAELKVYFTPADPGDGVMEGEAPASESGKDAPTS